VTMMIPKSPILYMAAALIAVSSVAGWSLWRLASAGARCEARISDARLAGNIAVAKLAADQQTALDALVADQNAALMRAWAMQSEAKTVTKWRVQWRDAGPAPVCVLSKAHIDAVNDAIR